MIKETIFLLTSLVKMGSKRNETRVFSWGGVSFFIGPQTRAEGHWATLMLVLRADPAIYLSMGTFPSP